MTTSLKLDPTAKALGMNAADALAVAEHLFAKPARRPLVTNDDWCVSFGTGDGIDGAILSVFHFADPRDLCSKIVRGDHDGRQFGSVAEAQEFALEHGYLQVYYSRAWSGLVREDRMEQWPHVGAKAWATEQARRGGRQR